MSSTYYDDAVAIKPDLVGFMQDIIRIPSLSSEEGAVIERIRDEMLRIGYDEVTEAEATMQEGRLLELRLCSL